MRTWTAGLMAAALSLTGMLATGVSPAAAVQATQDQVVSDNPVGYTPHVLDGEVDAIAQVGNLIILGGSFTRVRSATDATEISRRNLVAFDATTGAISETFNPSPDGAVTTVIPSADGTSVYVGGAFNTISGQTRRKVAQISVTTGANVAAFRNVGANGKVTDLRLVGNRLWVAGAFTSISATARPALVTLNATTGAFDPYMGLTVQGVHNGGTTTVAKIDVTPDGSRLVAIGNFDNVSGAAGHQAFMLDLTGPSAAMADWSTTFYTSTCASVFSTYLRDLDISPDGTYVVISTTGGYRGTTTSCDTTARFDLARTGTGIRPEWINYTGGDTTYAVAITGAAVYVGGHMRWQNNPFASDTAGAGSVARDGIAALDPSNGLPLTWNPGRTRGVGVFDMLATPTGLWVGSDTDRIGASEYHGRIAFLPLAGGTTVPVTATPSLPGAVVLLAPAAAAEATSVLYRVNAGGAVVASSDGGPTWAADTASTSAYRTSGSTAATWSAGVDTTAAVPSTTPNAVFSSERNDPSSSPDMQWSFPVAAGTPIQVRLYFANRSTATQLPGQRVFDVSLDGVLALDDYDIAAEVGSHRGTMKAFDLVSDGTVNIAFGRVVNNPLVNAIEIVRTDGVPAAATRVVRTTQFTGTALGATTDASGVVDFAGVRGAFMVNGEVYLVSANGSLVRRTFDGTAWGAPQAVSTSDLITPLAAWHDAASRLTGVFYDNGRMYYTVAGGTTLRMRYLTTQSGVVGAQEFTQASVAGVDLANVKGMFLASGWLYLVQPSGALQRVQWADGAMVAGTVATVSGPAVDGASWLSAAPFVYQAADGSAANFPPDAQQSVTCTDQVCAFSSAGSVDPGGAIVSYAWSFGDGTSSADAEATHTYAASGTYDVTLTVTDAQGATDSVTGQVSVTFVDQAPVGSFTATCTGRACSFDASASSDAEGPLAGYDWDFGDGTTASGATASHTFGADGSFDVVLTVTDAAGGTDTETQAVDVVYVFSPPVASFTTSCAQLACAFDAAASNDADGPIVAYAWTFGDGGTGTGVAPSHGFPLSGSYAVTLTVTDAQGVTATSTSTVDVAADGIEFVGAAAVNRSATTFPVAVPASATAGDVMVLLFSGNSTAVTVGDPAGWQPVAGGSSANGVIGRVWTRTVVAGDLGGSVTVTASAILKGDASLLVYRGVDPAAPVSASAIAFDTVTSAAHTTPQVAGVADGVLVSYWGEKSSASTTLAMPVDVTLRASSTGAGSGRVTAAAGETRIAVPATVGGLTATADSASSKAFMASIVLRPAS